MRISSLFVIGLCLAACAPKPDNAPPGPSWTSAERNIAYAVSAICAPYVLDGVEESALPMHQRLVHEDGWRESTFQKMAATPVRVGLACFVHVAVAESGGGRRCEITSRQADAQALRRAALQVLAARSEGFTPTKSNYLPGRFATEDWLCANVNSGHPGSFVLMSAASPQDQQRASVYLTMVDGPERPQSCDHAGVQLNFRTLASGANTTAALE